ncbi:MAG: radical SAM protein [Acidimicrobiales bacterium]|nr:MAG: radical SAM protein [Acidimicrobiales bacterium]
MHVASPAGALERAGHDVRALDLSVQPFDDGGPEALEWADALGLSVPMHTAMRMALRVAAAARRRRPELPICFYGLYAPVSQDLTVGALADRVIAGEYEPGLVSWVEELSQTHLCASARYMQPDAHKWPRMSEVGGAGPQNGGELTAAGDERGPVRVELGRGHFGLPARGLLPPLDRYARLAIGGEERLVGYVEASHGCAHRCRHCPVPVVYDGRTRLVGVEPVVQDVAQLVAMGARHLTFGDPDFLNGPHHSLRVIRAVHQAFPDLTFDCTVKVEHILRHQDLWAELATAGCLFVVSALESVNDDILARLDKGHTATEAALAVGVLRGHGIDLRPSLLPFTPWTTVADMVDLVDFVARHDLVGSVDPVHYSIRLLLPEGSLLLDRPDVRAQMGPYDATLLTWTWRPVDPALDELQAVLAAIAEQAATEGAPLGATFLEIRRAVMAAAAIRTPVAIGGGAGEVPPVPVPIGVVEERPRLTEAWFCCAEPTGAQLVGLE